MKKRIPVIGTRGSALALWQAHTVKGLLSAETQLKIIQTRGDKLLDIPLQKQIDKGFFTKEIEDRLLAGDIDLAVHSLKDLPTKLPPGLKVGAFIKRGPVTDLLVIRKQWHEEHETLPVKKNCVVGAGSLRRQALLKIYAGHAEPALLRGNVPTRIKKLADGKYGAIIIARAGVERLKADLGHFEVYELAPEIWLPAPGQGAVAVEAREKDEALFGLLTRVNDPVTEKEVFIERKLLENFEGGCHTAFGAYAKPNGAGWKVIFGMEDRAGAWLQKTVGGSLDECIAFTAGDIGELESLESLTTDGLCRRIKFSY